MKTMTQRGRELGLAMSSLQKAARSYAMTPENEWRTADLIVAAFVYVRAIETLRRSGGE
jgi:hypothetical protein